MKEYEEKKAEYEKKKAEYEKKKAEYEAKAADVKAAVIAEVKDDHEEWLAWWREKLKGYCYNCHPPWSSAEGKEKEAAQLPCCRQQEQEQRASAAEVELQQQRKKRKYGVYKLK